ncbi:MAG: DUF3795 domain-containing protein [Firmicutes bacterium]|jgi:hypothetical protein|nr:DUF3795 domain-containing protein [Bacillota bacterium]HPU62399.1 DUF3795 domain-containing protein [Bacillota bacterium]
MSKEGWDISVCGLNCAQCGLLAVEKMCNGCRGPSDKHWSPGCKFLTCARTNQLTYCFECNEFPCNELEAFANDGYEHHRLTVENMKKMREVGLETWLDQQSEPVFCPGWTKCSD